MGASKSDLYSENINSIAAMARVLAHPARVSILKYISEQEDCICNDIVGEVGLSQPTISQHLKVINEAGLLRGNFKGTSIRYCLNQERFKHLQELLNTFFNQTQSNCC